MKSSDRELLEQALEALGLYATSSPDVEETKLALIKRLDQPKQESQLVAVIGNWGRVQWADGVFPQFGDRMYSAPQPRQWQGLTGEEVGALTVFDGLHHVEVPVLADFVRAVEAKLKEKNA